eukprot:CAMPEP_0172443650 /NCGR_PEP_ID=MMETSP1065-20121228/3881_1 /TAXON_ID=265537 /ORGANISM="Amphiprora paludosa, Strain CCMP125" /LENGTH=710 /DNA_ID=CAMNT_0013193959 /DNA_START=34 /DNA_END=2166 /DNA_ORIENTATION=-
MGKHKNRGRKNRQKRQKDKQAQGPPDDDDGATATGGSSMLQKIRHSDPQTRLAALTALVHHNYIVNPQESVTLWQAVREQVMDRNLTVATAAVTCLEDVVVRSPSASSDMDLTTAGWYLILLGRAQEAYTQVTASTTEASSMSSTKKDQWISLALACLSALVCLVQENTVVTERLERTASLRRDSFAMLWQWLSYTLQSSNGDCVDLQEQVASLWHTLMEENPGVVQPWYEQEGEASQSMLRSVWDLVKTTESTTTAAATASSTSNPLSDLARLHLMGVVLAAVDQLPLLDPDRKARTLAVQPLLTSLQSYLVLPNAATTTQAEQWVTTFQKAQEQENDCNLEWAVVRQQSIKKEPARAIARRLKQQQQQQDAQKASMEADQPAETEGMEEEVDLQSTITKRGALPENRTDFMQEWQSLLEDWRRHHVALELALEMTANLTSHLGLPPPGEHDMMQVEEGPLDADIRHVFSNYQNLQVLLNQFTAQLWSSTAPLPPVIAQHVSDLQAKVAVCLAHVLAMMGGSETSDGNGLTTLWNDLIRAFDKQPSVAGTMVVALQTQPELCIKVLQPAHVDLFLSYLMADAPLSNDNATRDVVALLGAILCQQDHTREMNQKVCLALLKAGTDAPSKDSPPTSVSIMAETLNVLMDIYGDDDRHPDVFQEMNVLSHFQRTVPIVKQKLNIANDQDADAEFIGEIAMNASRFIQYKKGH